MLLINIKREIESFVDKSVTEKLNFPIVYSKSLQIPNNLLSNNSNNNKKS